MHPCVQDCREKWVWQKNRIYKHKVKTPRNDKRYARNEHFPIMGLGEYKRKCYIERHSSGIYPKCTGRARAQGKSQWLWKYWCSVAYHHQKEMWAIGAEKHLRENGSVLSGVCESRNTEGEFSGAGDAAQWERSCPECIRPWVRSNPQNKQQNTEMSYMVPQLWSPRT